MASHTSTGEWQSFEGRMRRRRAARLALRADVAAEAGWPDDAREWLEEARRLAPSLAEVKHVEQKLLVMKPAAPAPVADLVATPLPIDPGASPLLIDPGASAFRRKTLAKRKTLPAAAAILLIATAAAARFASTDPIAPSRELVAVPAPVAAASVRDDASFRLKAEATGIGSKAEATGIGASTASVRDDASSRLKEGSFRLKAEATPTSGSGIEGKRKPDDRAGRSAASAAPAVVFDAPALPAASPNSSLRLPSTPPPGKPEAAAPVASIALPEPAVAIAPLAPLPAAPAEISQDALVRSTLSRYAAAYSALDAEAAHRVWPGVNRGALTRAFDTLASQQVSLGDCNVSVTGANARAVCAGSATWTPKVGSGSPRTDARRWSFELEKAGPGWRIVNARVQNR